MKLRNYQEDIIKDVRNSLRNGHKRIIVTSNCGSGKTVTYSSMIKSATEKNNQVLFLVHRQELIDQTEATLKSFGVNMDLCNCIMVQTATRRINKLTVPNIIVIDEAHTSLSNSYIRIIEHFKDAIILGFTATPTRLSDGGLGKIYTDMVKSVSVKWLIENNYLAPYKYYGVRLIDLAGVSVKRGEYDSKQIDELLDTSKIYGDVVGTWEKLAKNKKTIIYCNSINSSRATVEEFQQAGYLAEHIDGGTPEKLRDEVIRKFRTGEIELISNVNLLSEG